MRLEHLEKDLNSERELKQSVEGNSDLFIM
jgi:hypothetical protein